jgi:hypothetical protein
MSDKSIADQHRANKPILSIQIGFIWLSFFASSNHLNFHRSLISLASHELVLAQIGFVV